MQRLASIALALALTLGGCATTNDVLAPRMTLIAASMVSPDPFSQQFRVRVHAENPNAEDMLIKGIEYHLFLEGDSFAEGKSQAPVVISANGSKDFDLPVTTHYSSAIARLLSRLEGTGREEIEYVFGGTVTIDASFSPKLKFSEGGLVKLNRR